MDDVRTLLRRAAPDPSTPVDHAAIARGRRRHRTSRVAAAATAGLAVASVVVLAGGPDGLPTPRIDPPPVATRPTEPIGTDPTTEAATAPEGARSRGRWRWSPTDGPDLADAANVAAGRVVASSTDLAYLDSGRWTVLDDVLPAAPDLLAASPLEQEWVLALDRTGSPVPETRATLLRYGEVRSTAQLPSVLEDGVTAVASDADGFVVVGRGGADADGTTAVVRLDPISGTWSRVGDLPVAAQFPWSTELVSTPDGLVAIVGNRVWDSQDGAASWTSAGTAPLAPEANAAVWTGIDLLAIGYDGMATTRTDGAWTQPVAAAVDGDECPPEAIAGGTAVLVLKCWQAGLLDLRTGQWIELEQPDVAAYGTAVPTPDESGFIVAVATRDGEVDWRRLSPDTTEDGAAAPTPPAGEQHLAGLPAMPASVPLPEPGRTLAVHIGQRPVVVVRAVNGTVTVVDAISPHQNLDPPKVLAWCAVPVQQVDPGAERDERTRVAEGLLDDLWHGSAFLPDGTYLGGPAPTGLPRYPVLATTGDTVTVGAPTAAPPRPLDPASLDFRSSDRCINRVDLTLDTPLLDVTVLDDMVLHDPQYPDRWSYPTLDRIQGAAPAVPTEPNRG